VDTVDAHQRAGRDVARDGASYRTTIRPHALMSHLSDSSMLNALSAIACRLWPQPGGSLAGG
jgi:hypothetical protein